MWNSYAESMYNVERKRLRGDDILVATLQPWKACLVIDDDTIDRMSFQSDALKHEEIILFIGFGSKWSNGKRFAHIYKIMQR